MLFSYMQEAGASLFFVVIVINDIFERIATSRLATSPLLYRM
jgi:hypothetical protein